MRIRVCYIGAFIHQTPTMAMFLPRFSGNDNYDPKNWIFWAELYFTYLDSSRSGYLYLCSTLMVNLFLGSIGCFAMRYFFQNYLKDNSSEVNSAHVVSQSAVASPFCAPKSWELISKHNIDVEPIEDIDTPQIENINSVEAKLVNEPSSITEGQVIDKIPHTTVSSNIHDMKVNIHGFKHYVSTVTKVYSVSLWEEKSHDNMVLLENFPPLNTFGFLFAFAY
ncbi:hypothetical protein H5410_015317 [Solanum commersonii]|uniref:Uncharacterized protein n=1 Tax=Solanum commersonii TaxID=4109 RepID=A0A9J5ZT73_SOLCO|nr:hypothetical protein H5410_015317 [Solanum commersonii]